ncbi:DNA-binding response regulator [Marinobacter flavimaris]|uniref:DNA-binding response regulator n=1 Tax=Marinobacter flavimaris TaxID=262076 RepID=A0A3D8H6N0_9GAMM|nr:response regulator transcription factor [Marinobacter flavimaris]PPI81524.1 DNA-binding response regulator [Marinobacter flavimaris]RDU41976.1 DNA-binding response regulator [Marinobacter flavimaris]
MKERPGWTETKGRASKVRILVSDDHELIRDGISILLKKLLDNPTVLEAETGDEAISIAEDHRDLDLAVIDLSLPGVNGLPMVSKLCQLLPETPILILSASADRNLVLKTIESGASGFVYKSLGTTVLEDALQMVLAGGVFIPPLVEDEDTELTGITPRQRQILELLAQGKSNKEMANTLHISANTIKNHLAKLYDQFSVSNRTQAVMKAQELTSGTSM